uniref:Uncharacterized protein n=1 Tax=Acrobeloides nanus TaxID=290746 RepID=A0A914EPQ1_9BILA
MPNTRSHVLATPIPTNVNVQPQPDSVPISSDVSAPMPPCQCRKALDPRIRSAPFLQPICLSCSNVRVKVVLRIKNAIIADLKRIFKTKLIGKEEYNWLMTIFDKSWPFPDTSSIRKFAKFNISPHIMVDDQNTWLNFLLDKYRRKLLEVIAEMYKVPKGSVKDSYF